MCSSLLQEIYRLLLLIQILLIISGGQCAPKLGGILFEQLFLETFMDDENNTNANYKREFTVRVPVYQTNIKNSTSLYAKLTGNSIINSEVSLSRHKNKELKHIENNVNIFSNNSDFNNSTGITKYNLTTSFPSTFTSTAPLTTVKINTTNHSSKPEKPTDGKTVKHVEKEKTKWDVTKSKLKDNKSQKSPVMPKIRRDGAMLQSNGYAFNGNYCQMRGDRVICGYNNQELETTEPESADKDCILRGDRIECGYVNRRTDNRRNNKENKAVETGSEIKNVTDNLTTNTTVASYTNTTIKSTYALPLIDSTKTTNPTSTGNTEEPPELSKFKTQELLDVEKSIASVITNANTSTTTSTSSATTTTIDNDSATISNMSTSTTITKEQPKFAGLKIMELIDRVEKLLDSADTIKTFNLSYPIVASNKSSTSLSTLQEEPADILNLTIIKSNDTSVSLASTVTLTNFSVNVSTTTSSTFTTSTTTTSTPTMTTTPVPYIDDGEYCVEKDGRIVCYDSPQEDYDDFLEK